MVCPRHKIQVSRRSTLDMISLEPRPVGMWVPCPLPDKEILLCWDNEVGGRGLGLENQGITVNSWHMIRSSSSPEHHDLLSHSPVSSTMRTEGTFPCWGVKITTRLDLTPRTWEAKPPLPYMSPYHDTKLSTGTITFKGSQTPKCTNLFPRNC